MKKKKIDIEPINTSFEDAMRKIANTPAKEVDKAMKAESTKKQVKPRRGKTAPK